MLLLNLPYFGCVAHWALIASGECYAFDIKGRHQRRTFRTRTVIGMANGEQALTVPTESNYSKPYHDILINDDTDWRHQHLYALMSAYSNTPFYEYYIDDIKNVIEGNWTSIWEMNMELHRVIARLLDIPFTPILSEEEMNNMMNGSELKDLRIGIEPKYQHKLQDTLNAVPYYQVFSERCGFRPWLSISDLLFNMGPESRLILRAMQKD